MAVVVKKNRIFSKNVSRSKFNILCFIYVRGLEKMKKNTCTDSKFEFVKSFVFVFRAIGDVVKRKLLLLLNARTEEKKRRPL
jgi:hypothetical protein